MYLLHGIVSTVGTGTRRVRPAEDGLGSRFLRRFGPLLCRHSGDHTHPTMPVDKSLTITAMPKTSLNVVSMAGSPTAMYGSSPESPVNRQKTLPVDGRLG